MKESQTPSYYRLRPAIVSPILVCSGAIGMSFIDSPWWLTALPFAVLASVCAQPNMNLADYADDSDDSAEPGDAHENKQTEQGAGADR